jgi:hypothetical protein
MATTTNSLPRQLLRHYETLIHTFSDLTPSDDPIVQAENLIKSALDKLESTGVLRRSN